MENIITPTSAFDLDAYLNELDKSSSRPSNAFIPEIRLIQGDVNADKYKVPKGTYVAILRGENGEDKFEVLGEKFKAVILHETNQYAIYDETEKKNTYSTNEFEGRDATIFVRDHINNDIIADGLTQSTFKDWALRNFPKGLNTFGKMSHQFSFKYVFYVYVASLKDKMPEGQEPIFKVFGTVAAMENINAYRAKLGGHPIRYVTEISCTKKVVGQNIYFQVNMDPVENLDIPSLTAMCQFQMTLKDFIYQAISNSHAYLSAPKQAPALPSGSMEYDFPDDVPASQVVQAPASTAPKMNYPAQPVTDISSPELDSLFNSQV